MKIYVPALLVLLALPVRSAIVFDGTDSYASHEGRAARVGVLCNVASDGVCLLKEAAPGQMDYTTSDRETQSRISDPRGMILEAEGIYSIIIRDFLDGKNRGCIRHCKGGNGFALGSNSESEFCYKIEVRTSGIYTFAIDAAGKRETAELRMYGLQDFETLSDTTEPLAIWSGYDSGSWTNIVQNFGGPDKGKPFSIEVRLEAPMKKLVFVMKENFNLDCIRITGFKPLNAPPTASKTTAPTATEEKAVAGDSGKMLLCIALIAAGSGLLVLCAATFAFSRRKKGIKKQLIQEAEEPQKTREW